MPVVTRDVKSIRKAGDTKLKGDVTLSQGTNVVITQVGQDIQISVPSATGFDLTTNFLLMGA